MHYGNQIARIPEATPLNLATFASPVTAPPLSAPKDIPTIGARETSNHLPWKRGGAVLATPQCAARKQGWPVLLFLSRNSPALQTGGRDRYTNGNKNPDRGESRPPERKS